MGDAALSSTPRPERPLSHDPALPIGTPGKGGGPSSDGVWIPSQGLRRTRSRPSLGQEPDSVPSFTLPGSRRQNKPPVQIPAIHGALLGTPMAAYSGCGERDGGIGHGKMRSRTGLARVGGDVGGTGGRAPSGWEWNGSQPRARLWVSQGQRCGRCRRAERVRPARAKTRRLRVLVVTICSPRPMRAVQRARLCPSPEPPARRRWRQNGRTACGSARRRT